MTVTVNPQARLVFLWRPDQERTEHLVSRQGIICVLTYLFTEWELVRAWEGLEYVFRKDLS